ncbi:Rha family transcriptional regulator [Burkholderia vietnamiensis]|nr:Rha family transcriptional regulator [Burkholderia vietnamiensis]
MFRIIHCSENLSTSTERKRIGVARSLQVYPSGTRPARVAKRGSATCTALGSKELAKLTGKRHDNVKRTIDALVRASVVTSPQIEEKATAGRPVAEYLVGERDSYIVAAQLSPQFMAKIVDRWRALEAEEVTPRGDAPGISDLREDFEALLRENTRLRRDVKDAEWAASCSRNALLCPGRLAGAYGGNFSSRSRDTLPCIFGKKTKTQ